MPGLTEILLIAVILLLLFGPTKLPQLGRTLGESLRSFRKASRGESDIDVTDSVKRLGKDD